MGAAPMRNCKVDRRRLLAAGAGAALAGAGLARPLQAQSESSPSGGHNPFSQPEATFAGPEGLVAVLSCVPLSSMLVLNEGSGVHWYYADLAQQFDAVGVSRDEDGPDDGNEAWLPALMTLATASNAFQFARVPEFTDAVGFNPLGVDQTLLVGDPPNQLTLFRGALDPARLAAAWDIAGYTMMSTSDGTSFWSIGTDGEVDLEHPVQRSVIAAFNNLALEGDILFCAPNRDLLEMALATARGDSRSALESPAFGPALRTLPETTVSAIALRASAVGMSSNLDSIEAGPVDDLIVQSDAEVGSMPPHAGLITAVGAGAVTNEDGAGAGTAMIRIVTGSADAAEQVTKVVEYSWNEGTSLRTTQPYTNLMEITVLDVDGDVAMIDFQQVSTSRVWSDLFFTRDTLPFIQ